MVYQLVATGVEHYNECLRLVSIYNDDFSFDDLHQLSCTSNEAEIHFVNKYIIQYFQLKILLTLAKIDLSFITYSYVVNKTLNLEDRICVCNVRRIVGEPL